MSLNVAVKRIYNYNATFCTYGGTDIRSGGYRVSFFLCGDGTIFKKEAKRMKDRPVFSGRHVPEAHPT